MDQADQPSGGGSSDSEGASLRPPPKRAKSKSRVWEKVAWFARRPRGSRGERGTAPALGEEGGAACLPAPDAMETDEAPSSSSSASSGDSPNLSQPLSEYNSSSEGDIHVATAGYGEAISSESSQVVYQSCVRPSLVKAMFGRSEGARRDGGFPGHRPRREKSAQGLGRGKDFGARGGEMGEREEEEQELGDARIEEGKAEEEEEEGVGEGQGPRGRDWRARLAQCHCPACCSCRSTKTELNFASWPPRNRTCPLQLSLRMAKTRLPMAVKLASGAGAGAKAKAGAGICAGAQAGAMARAGAVNGAGAGVCAAAGAVAGACAALASDRGLQGRRHHSHHALTEEEPAQPPPASPCPSRDGRKHSTPGRAEDVPNPNQIGSTHCCCSCQCRCRCSRQDAEQRHKSRSLPACVSLSSAGPVPDVVRSQPASPSHSMAAVCRKKRDLRSAKSPKVPGPSAVAKSGGSGEGQSRSARSSKAKGHSCHLGVEGAVFKHRMEMIHLWFHEFNDQQKNTMMKRLLEQCDLPQMHMLSVTMAPILHQSCPHNCQDLLSWLPAQLSLRILAYLDPVSLCRCAGVSRAWYELANEPSLWRNLCRLPKWALPKAEEQKQMINHISSYIHWKQAFAERYKLRRNWLKGQCSVRTFEGHTQGISCVQFDDTRIVSGSSDNTIKVWNIRTNSPWSVQTLVGHSGTVRCLHLQGSQLVSGSTDRTIKVWDLSMQNSWSSIACRVTMTGHEDTVRCLQVDDEKVVSGSYDKTLKVWDIRTGHCRHTLRGHTGAVLCLQFDTAKIVSGSADKTIKIWSLATGSCLRSLEGHRDAVTCLQFDASKIISGSLDRNLKFWELTTGFCTSTIDWAHSEGHTGVVRCLQADSWRVVSASDDRTLKVWNLETGERLVTLRHHTDGVTCLQFNNSKIVSGSYDKTVRLWDFSSM